MLNYKTKTMKTIKTIKLLALLFMSSLAIVSCSSDDDGDHHDDDHDHENELITTVIYTLTNTSDSSVVTLTFRDLDGPGGQDPEPIVVSGPLAANATYTGELKLWNETESPAEDISEEIAEMEADEHEVFYVNTAGVTIAKTDVDANNNPLGFDTNVTTGAAGSGSLTVILIHEPTKPNDGTPNGAGGSTDIEVSYPIEVQ